MPASAATLLPTRSGSLCRGPVVCSYPGPVWHPPEHACGGPCPCCSGPPGAAGFPRRSHACRGRTWSRGGGIPWAMAVLSLAVAQPQNLLSWIGGGVTVASSPGGQGPPPQCAPRTTPCSFEASDCARDSIGPSTGHLSPSSSAPAPLCGSHDFAGLCFRPRGTQGRDEEVLQLSLTTTCWLNCLRVSRPQQRGSGQKCTCRPQITPTALSLQHSSGLATPNTGPSLLTGQSLQRHRPTQTTASSRERAGGAPGDRSLRNNLPAGQLGPPHHHRPAGPHGPRPSLARAGRQGPRVTGTKNSPANQTRLL